MSMKRLVRYVCLVMAVLAALIWFNNTSLLSPEPGTAPTLLAHRGLAQTFTRDGLNAETCTAQRIYPPEHGFIENTLPSMKAAFDAGADIVEFDIHPTTDGQFAVFHDWSVDCRTNGKGVTRDHTLADLKALDVGYGYTADGGRTYPLRGKGVGLMPSLEEVLAAFPGKRFLIHIKSNDASEGEKLAAHLTRLAPEARHRLMVYGGTLPVEALHALLPGLRVGSKASLKGCVVSYIKIGWLGRVPQACHGSMMFVPINVAPWLWGWPDRLQQRLRDANVELFVLGPYDGGEFSSGIDDVTQLESLPRGYGGGIWTNRIDRIAPAMRGSKAAAPPG